MFISGEAKNLPSSGGIKSTFCILNLDREEVYRTATVEKSTKYAHNNCFSFTVFFISIDMTCLNAYQGPICVLSIVFNKIIQIILSKIVAIVWEVCSHFSQRPVSPIHGGCHFVVINNNLSEDAVRKRIPNHRCNTCKQV